MPFTLAPSRRRQADQPALPESAPISPSPKEPTKCALPSSPNSALCQAMLDRITSPTGAYLQARLVALQRFQKTSADGRAWLREQLEAEVRSLSLQVWRPHPLTTPDEWRHLHDRLERAQADLDTLCSLRRR